MEQSDDRLKRPILVVFMVRQSRPSVCRRADTVSAVMQPLLDTSEDEASVRRAPEVRC
jgi:hypothetical protein